MKKSIQYSYKYLEKAIDEKFALFTDLYEMKMLQAYHEERMNDMAVFTLFVRRLPASRNFLLACGLDTALEYLENLRFSESDIQYLKSLGQFSQQFLEGLRDFQFTGDVWAVPEGTPVFANEPILEIAAPMPEAQLVETFVMNQVHLQTLLASKAARVVLAAAGRPVIDFGARRIHGLDAAIKAARAFYIAGVTATSNVIAGKIYGMPVSGTVAHSYIQAHDDEADAYRNFAKLYPDTVLLVDTYDTLAGVRKVIDLAKELGEEFQVKAVRLDSGNLLGLSKDSRRLLDEAGLKHVDIFASGSLDENRISKLISQGAPIDGFGVGTSMGVSNDAPDLDIAYKLCEYAGKGRLKLSSGKPVLPGRKQIFRETEKTPSGERFKRDIITRANESLEGKPLLEPVMKGGKRLPVGKLDLENIRAYTARQISCLPDSLKRTDIAPIPYQVDISHSLAEYQRIISEEILHTI